MDIIVQHKHVLSFANDYKTYFLHQVNLVLPLIYTNVAKIIKVSFHLKGNTASSRFPLQICTL